MTGCAADGQLFAGVLPSWVVICNVRGVNVKSQIICRISGGKRGNDANVCGLTIDEFDGSSRAGEGTGRVLVPVIVELNRTSGKYAVTGLSVRST